MGGAQRLVHLYSNLDRSNDGMKNMDSGYKKLSLSPRLFFQMRGDEKKKKGSCGVNGCLEQPECGHVENGFLKVVGDLEGHPPPTVFLLGQAKCGTTSLFQTLVFDHSQDFCLANALDNEPAFYRKEQHFFSSSPELDNLKWSFPRYMQHF